MYSMLDLVVNSCVSCQGDGIVYREAIEIAVQRNYICQGQRFRITRNNLMCLSDQVKSLVRLSGSLASLELIKVPAADANVALVLIHAAAEVANIDLTCWGLERGLRAGVALVEAVVHGLGRGSLLGLGRGAGTTAEEATDGVTNSDTTISERMLAHLPKNRS